MIALIIFTIVFTKLNFTLPNHCNVMKRRYEEVETADEIPESPLKKQTIFKSIALDNHENFQPEWTIEHLQKLLYPKKPWHDYFFYTYHHILRSISFLNDIPDSILSIICEYASNTFKKCMRKCPNLINTKYLNKWNKYGFCSKCSQIEWINFADQVDLCHGPDCDNFIYINRFQSLFIYINECKNLTSVKMSVWLFYSYQKGIEYCYKCKYYYCKECYDIINNMCHQCLFSSRFKFQKEVEYFRLIKCNECNKEIKIKVNNAQSQCYKCKECKQNFCPDCFCDCYDKMELDDKLNTYSIVKGLDTDYTCLGIYWELIEIRFVLQEYKSILIVIANYARGNVIKCVNYSNCKEIVLENDNCFKIMNNYGDIKYLFCASCCRLLLQCDFIKCNNKIIPTLKKQSADGKFKQLCLEHQCCLEYEECKLAAILVYDDCYDQFFCLKCDKETKCSFENCKHRIIPHAEKFFNHQIEQFCEYYSSRYKQYSQCDTCGQLLNNKKCYECHPSFECCKCRAIICSNCQDNGRVCGIINDSYNGCLKFACNKCKSTISWLQCSNCYIDFCCIICKSNHSCV